MTNQQGAPEAPRGTASDGKSELFNVPGYPLMVRAADFNRLHAENERLAALVEAQQPAPSEQQPFGWIKQSEIDSSNDFGGSINLWRRQYNCDVPVYLAPQPSPTPQADIPAEQLALLDAATCEMQERTKISTTLIGIPTPQADSQPAPVLDGSTPGEWFVRKLMKNGELVDCFVAAPDYLGFAYDAEILGDDEYRDKPESDETSGIRRKLADCELIVAAVKQYRAARAQADSVTAPAGPIKPLPYEPTSTMLIAARERDPALPIETVRAIYWSMWRTAPTPPAQAAPGVLEDAARLERERICAAIKAEDDYCVDQGDYMLDSDDCIKIVRGEWVRPDFAVDAARKQGGAT